MSENLRKLLSDFEFISRIDCPKTRKILLAYISRKPKYYKALKEISKNIISGNIKKPKSCKKRLSSQDRKRIIRLSKSKSAKQSKKLIVQSGGWMWVIPLVAEIIRLL